MDTQFISTSDHVELSSIFEDVEYRSIATGIIDRWADEALNNMLNYVYFYTEPMEKAKRHHNLDFSMIEKSEPIPRFKLTKGNLTKSEKEKIREKIQEKLSQRKAVQMGENFTPPKYDEIYFEGMQILEEESDYS